MLSDTKLRSLKARASRYKVADKDGLFADVMPTGAVAFRYNYTFNGRQETVTFGRYGVGGITLAEAREKLHNAKRAIAEGRSPAVERAREKARLNLANAFGAWAEAYFAGYKMAESTRDMRRSIYERDMKGHWARRRMEEITDEDVRLKCDAIAARGAPATAVHVRDIGMGIYQYACDRGKNFANPFRAVKPSSIATFEPRDRVLTPEEIGTAYEYLDKVAGYPQFKIGAKLLLLTMVRKSELAQAEWTEFSFADRVWSIPAERMKRRRPHLVFLSQQVMDYLVALKTLAGSSKYVLPSRYEATDHMSAATFNRLLDSVWKGAQADGQSLARFGPHDLRRTASTLLHEAGYNSDWIEKCLAHEQRNVRTVYNKAEYREQRATMMQDWANMIDEWTAKRGSATALYQDALVGRPRIYEIESTPRPQPDPKQPCDWSARSDAGSHRAAPC